MDAEAPRLVGAGGDDAALAGSRADDDGLAAPLGMVQELDGREERVHIDMEDRRHGLGLYHTPVRKAVVFYIMAAFLIYYDQMGTRAKETRRRRMSETGSPGLFRSARR